MSTVAALRDTPQMFIDNQVNAVTRVLVVFEQNGPMTFDDVLRILAQAETNARFMCGFNGLRSATAYTRELWQYLVDQGFVSLDAGEMITLTPAGQNRGTTPLPDRIEIELHKLL